MFDIYDIIIMAFLYAGTMITSIILYNKSKRIGNLPETELLGIKYFFTVLCVILMIFITIALLFNSYMVGGINGN